MLYSKGYITPSTLIGIWKIEESRDDLLSLLQYHEWVQNIYPIKSESRVLEILSARILIKELIGEEKEVYYNNTGKPFLSDESYHISVSHTKGYVAVAVNKENAIGLDIEHISEKIRRVRSRVIGEDEYIDEKNELIHLLLHWSAKEAMFKFIDAEGVDFLHHLFVDRFTPDNAGMFKASEKRTDKNLRFNAYYQVERDFVMVCLEAG
ncbi:MAG: 4'-phosphopantetheinyl transferase superfamily protein [Prevotella sp.]|jgi:phosphopantetheinyl transferase|nr:4'-phosphopantetheinyl transferase superfamily protein [Prevotella sp.]